MLTIGRNVLVGVITTKIYGGVSVLLENGDLGVIFPSQLKADNRCADLRPGAEMYAEILDKIDEKGYYWWLLSERLAYEKIVVKLLQTRLNEPFRGYVQSKAE